MEIANGFNVRIEGLGTFGCKLGLRPDKEMDGFDEGEKKRNARSSSSKSRLDMITLPSHL